jgi:phosphoribosylanthranilate isomerase
MSLTVKICGLSTEDTLDAALAGGADMVGFVFFQRSPRYVANDRAAALVRRVRGRAETAALAVDFDNATLDAIVATVNPDWLQLHGEETPERVTEIRRRFGKRVMKAIGVAGTDDLDTARRYFGVADMLLLDAKPPKDATRPGGNARAFDWVILAGFQPPIPYLLSGGLSPANVAEAIRITGAPGVDVSSGVETAPGVKSADLIRAFIANARAAVATKEKVAS